MAPSSSPFPSEKIPITDPNPKPDPNTASSSSTTGAPPPEKRTRDQPNLSDCHCCSRRINFTNPKDRLQPLDSVWRIVLLCLRCRKSLNSGQKCSYCFQETGNSGDLLTCTVCLRKIHSNCVRDYRNCTPWCYLGVGLEGFRVCVDCWVPESLKNSVRVPGRTEIKGGLKHKGETVDSLENVAGDAKCGVLKKVKRVGKAKVKLMANGKTNAVDLKDGAFDLSVEKDTSNCSDAVLRGESVVNCKWKGLSYKRSRSRNIWCDDQKIGAGDDVAEDERMNQPVENDPNTDGGLIPYKRDRRRKIWALNSENIELENLHLDDPSTICSTKCGADTSANTDQQKGDRQLVIYRRTRFKKKEAQPSGMLAVSRDSSYCGSHGVALKSDNSQPDDTNLSTGSPSKKDTKVILPSESCDTESDRYQLKYFKRTTGTKPYSFFLHSSAYLSVDQVAETAISNSEAGCSMDNDELSLPNGTCDQETDRYSLKYAKRLKSSKSASNFEAELQFLNKIGISAESRTVPDASGDFLTIVLPK